MKTIEERANEYIGHPMDIDEPFFVTSKRLAFIAGAKSEHTLLSEWHSPDDIPDTNRYVLIKIDNTPEYAVGYYNINDDSWHSPSFFEINSGFIG